MYRSQPAFSGLQSAMKQSMAPLQCNHLSTVARWCYGMAGLDRFCCISIHCWIKWLTYCAYDWSLCFRVLMLDAVWHGNALTLVHSFLWGHVLTHQAGEHTQSYPVAGNAQCTMVNSPKHRHTHTLMCLTTATIQRWYLRVTIDQLHLAYLSVWWVALWSLVDIFTT